MGRFLLIMELPRAHFAPLERPLTRYTTPALLVPKERTVQTAQCLVLHVTAGPMLPRTQLVTASAHIVLLVLTSLQLVGGFALVALSGRTAPEVRFRIRLSHVLIALPGDTRT